MEAYFPASGNTSHRARPVCHWRGGSPARIPRTAGDGIAFEVTPERAGETLLHVIYENDAGPINTGITCAVKHVEVRDAATGEIVAEEYVMMPHLRKGDQGVSSPVRAELRAGNRYTVTVSPDPRAINMSAFAHFARYTGGAGGHAGPKNHADIVALELLPVR